MKKNLRLKVLTGQMLVIEDITEWSIDTLGLHATYQEETVEKVGDQINKRVDVKKVWFNTAGIVTASEEFVKA